MSVIAKFYVQKLTRHEGAPTADKLEMGAVCRGPQNKAWASATPWGTITMGVLNEAATDYFIEGEEYEVVFRHVAKPTPGDGHEPIPAHPPWDYEKVSPECEFCGLGLGIHGDYDGTAKHAEIYGA
jgi:hypothetical protein